MPPRRTAPAGYAHGRRLRKEPTEAEVKMWSYLRRGNLRGARFRRQHAIGPYVTDFCCPKARLIIELDGSPHLKQADRDLERTKSLTLKGYRVLRFWNSDVMNDIDGVVVAILNALGDK